MSETQQLPQMNGKTFITDGGLETTVIFRDNIELPAFSSIHLMRSEAGRDYLRRYFDEYIELANSNKLGLVLETPTWRASSDWAEEIGVSVDELTGLTVEATAFVRDIKLAKETADSPLVVAGCLGPRGDGYKADEKMSVAEAKAYHLPHIQALREGGADFVSALTITYAEEAIGIIQASKETGIPVAMSFTVETDGTLPGGENLIDTITAVDEVTDDYASYYMINCAHPTHFENILATDSPIKVRIGGVRANASCKSHEEIDNSPELDEGDPVELGRQIVDIHRNHSHVRVLGGCCGTDIRHIREICNHR